MRIRVLEPCLNAPEHSWPIPIAFHRPAGPAPPPGRAAGGRHQGGRRRRAMDSGAAGRAVRKGHRGLGGREACHRLRQRHRCAAAGAARLGRRARAMRCSCRPSPLPPAAKWWRWPARSPVFVDVLPDTFNMDPASLEAAIALVKKDGKLTPKVVMPVDLFGQPADYRALAPIAKREGPEAVLRYGAGFWRLAGRQARRRHRRCRRHQLLSRQAAGLLWRWRRLFHQ